MSSHYGALLGFAAVCLLTTTVQASHYPIEVVPFIEQAHKDKLATLNLTETADLLDALLTGKQRKEMATRSGIAVETLLDYATTCDLLRLRGVGPKMARLIKLAGVADVQALRAQNPDDLAVALQEANKKHGVSEILPQKDTLKDWIHQARGLKIVITE